MKEQREEIIISKNGSAVALGFFDGIHLGHRAVITRMVSYAKEKGLTPVVYTFKKNPASLLGKSCEIITPNEERRAILKEIGVELVAEDDFLSVQNMLPETFVQKILVKRLRAKKVFCGFNYHFGKGGRADSRDLKKICSVYHIETETLPPVVAQGDTVSSTRIRNLIKKGEISEANKLLGYNFGFSSVIEEGNHIGRLMETPTINQKLPEGLAIPKFGVYTSIVTVEGKTYPGVTNIGVKPTIGNYSPLSETWLPKYNGPSLYGKKTEVRLLLFQRPERKFSSIKELEDAIKRDGQNALRNIESLYTFEK